MDTRVVLQRPTIKNRGNLHGMSTSLNSGKLRETNNAVTRVTSNGRPQIYPGHAACFHRLLMIITHISGVRFHHVPKWLGFYLQILFNKETIWSIGCLFFSFQICISRYQEKYRADNSWKGAPLSKTKMKWETQWKILFTAKPAASYWSKWRQETSTSTMWQAVTLVGSK